MAEGKNVITKYYKQQQYILIIKKNTNWCKCIPYKHQAQGSCNVNINIKQFKIRENSTVMDQFISVAQLCSTLCDPMDCSSPGFPVHHQLPELAQTHVHRVSDAIQPSHPLLSPSMPTFNLSQHQGLFQWVSSSHQVTKLLEFQFWHQFCQWIFRTDFL